MKQQFCFSLLGSQNFSRYLDLSCNNLWEYSFPCPTSALNGPISTYQQPFLPSNLFALWWLWCLKKLKNLLPKEIVFLNFWSSWFFYLVSEMNSNIFVLQTSTIWSLFDNTKKLKICLDLIIILSSGNSEPPFNAIAPMISYWILAADLFLSWLSLICHLTSLNFV